MSGPLVENTTFLHYYFLTEKKKVFFSPKGPGDKLGRMDVAAFSGR